MIIKERDLSPYFSRCDSLTAEAQNLLTNCIGTDGMIADKTKFSEWRTKAATLMTLVVPMGHIHRSKAESLATLSPSIDEYRSTIGWMRGVKDDLAKGMLVPLVNQIEAEFAADFMKQATDLLSGDGELGNSYYLPAAVLVGAILERGLRTLCSNQDPVIPTKKSGKFVMMGELISELKATKVISSQKAKQLEAWVVLRNQAAHGEFESVDKADVQAMIEGVGRFLNGE